MTVLLIKQDILVYGKLRKLRLSECSPGIDLNSRKTLKAAASLGFRPFNLLITDALTDGLPPIGMTVG